MLSLYSSPKRNIKYEIYEEFFRARPNRFVAGEAYYAKHTRLGSRLIKEETFLKAVQTYECETIPTNEPTYLPICVHKTSILLEIFQVITCK